ncbi:hypothetical protein MY3296_007931 [Beauveria thailandica]
MPLSTESIIAIIGLPAVVIPAIIQFWKCRKWRKLALAAHRARSDAELQFVSGYPEEPSDLPLYSSPRTYSRAPPNEYTDNYTRNYIGNRPNEQSQFFFLTGMAVYQGQDRN